MNYIYALFETLQRKNQQLQQTTFPPKKNYTCQHMHALHKEQHAPVNKVSYKFTKTYSETWQWS
jgi:hypothetical protein